MKIIFLSFLLYMPCILCAQVGINTKKPMYALDVNGDMLLRGELKIGTNVGQAGQVLVSQGPNKPPTWQTYELETLETGNYVLTNLEIKEDRVGLTLQTDYSSSVKYGDALTSDWTVLDGLTNEITIKQNKNQIIYNFQTVLQSPYALTTNLGNSNSINVLCGIFLGKKGQSRSTYKLTTVRQGVLSGNHYPEDGFTIIASTTDTPPGTYEVIIAFQRRGGTTSLTSLPLYVGRSFDTKLSYNVSNNFMNKSVVRVDVFEPNNK